MAANWTALQDALQAAVVAATSLPGASVIWERQKLPRPARPFITLRHDLDVMSQNPERTQANNPSGQAGDPNAIPPVLGTELLIGITDNVEFTLRVQAFTAEVSGGSDARSLLVKVRNAFSAEGFCEALAASGVVPFECATVHDLTDLLETKFEGRAALDIRCRVEDGYTQAGTYIQTVKMTFTKI